MAHFFSLWVRRIALTLACLSVLTLPAWADTPDLSGFLQLEADEAPDEITRNSHYVISNELNHHLFRSHVQDLGGVFVGVGSDQLYLIAGWMKPEVIVPLDFDSVIVDIHRIYGVIFRDAQTPKDFLKAWHKKNLKKTAQLVEDKLGDTCTRCRKIFEQSQKKVAWRLRRTKRDYQALKVPTFLSDETMYTRVANLHREGRVFPIRGDLRKDKAIRSVSRAAKQANIPIRALYFSNAEQYFRYAKPFQENIDTLFSDEKSVVLRTKPKGKKHTNSDDYWYYIQTVDHFRKYLPNNLGSRVYRLFRYSTEVPDSEGRAYILNKLPRKKQTKKRRGKKKRSGKKFKKSAELKSATHAGDEHVKGKAKATVPVPTDESTQVEEE